MTTCDWIFNPIETVAMTSPQSIDRARVECSVIQIIDAWASSHPHEVNAIKQTTKAFKDGLINRKAISRGGNMLHKAEIPTSLYHMMILRFGRFWQRDQRLLNLFLKNFKIGCVNHSSIIQTRFSI